MATVWKTTKGELAIHHGPDVETVLFARTVRAGRRGVQLLWPPAGDGHGGGRPTRPSSASAANALW